MFYGKKRKQKINLVIYADVHCIKMFHFTGKLTAHWSEVLVLYESSTLAEPFLAHSTSKRSSISLGPAEKKKFMAYLVNKFYIILICDMA